MRFMYHPVDVYRQKYAVLGKFYDNESARLFADVVERDNVDAPIDAYLIMIKAALARDSLKKGRRLGQLSPQGGDLVQKQVGLR